MIARIRGQLEELTESTVIVATGDLAYEVLIPACDVERLHRRLGQPVIYSFQNAGSCGCAAQQHADRGV